MAADKRMTRAREVGIKSGLVLRKRVAHAREAFAERVRQATPAPGDAPSVASMADPAGAFAYALDAGQRAILFWDTLRERGNQFVEHTVSGLKPVLHFDYDMVLDGRTFDRPVNYALLRIKPPDGVTVDDSRRPYVIIDPRAGHGPGIGGFKDDSQVGVALRAGHPVYFVIFFRDPEPGQTLLDVCEAEQKFVKWVRARHPDSSKPAIVGNCQGGWAAMMVAASDPDDTGPIVINGAPMSYWSGAWQEGEGDNPMRYAGGLLGGTWLASLTADLGDGRFDGAHLVQNFENLNPANTFWDKYYNLYRKVDTEPPRFLEFERWWGGFYLMNREEIEWITRNLFVGNKLWSDGGERGTHDHQPEHFDLRNIKSPIILFASMGDNITPPQQAFNWVADLYGSTDEIKARGQVIVGMMHESVGHLGIFVSGKVARKEHKQIVSVLRSIESLPPGLYGMAITETGATDPQSGEPEYEVTFREHRLEDIVERFNRFERVDEKPFETVAGISELNQRAYELFAQPFVQAMSNETTARMLREWHPLRVQNWMFSDLNPWMAWVKPAAEAVRANRQALGDDDPMRQREAAGAEMVSAALDHYRALRDAFMEAAFFGIFGTLRALSPREGDAGARRRAPRVPPEIEQAMAALNKGTYVDALARVAVMLTRDGKPLPLARLELRKELAEDYADLLPEVDTHAWRTTRGLQEIIVRGAPAEALQGLPIMLRDNADRRRLLTLLDKVAADERVIGATPSEDQRAMLARIRAVLSSGPRRPRHVA
ncbi:MULTISPECIES: DUF3141 domain-containing protein [unclassified Cupriavidus]|uniref:DUF3141 domain-containing protein n=1 Tax=unclassified Cupriavidus TaxID=2640874 RepID=UPI00313BDFDA